MRGLYAWGDQEQVLLHTVKTTVCHTVPNDFVPPAPSHPSSPTQVRQQPLADGAFNIVFAVVKIFDITTTTTTTTYHSLPSPYSYKIPPPLPPHAPHLITHPGATAATCGRCARSASSQLLQRSWTPPPPPTLTPLAFELQNTTPLAPSCHSSHHPPKCDCSHLRTVRAFSIVSAVVKVLDTTTTSVSSGLRPLRARATSMGSTLARKRSSRPLALELAVGSVLEKGRREEGREEGREVVAYRSQVWGAHGHWRWS